MIVFDHIIDKYFVVSWINPPHHTAPHHSKYIQFVARVGRWWWWWWRWRRRRKRRRATTTQRHNFVAGTGATSADISRPPRLALFSCTHHSIISNVCSSAIFCFLVYFYLMIVVEIFPNRHCRHLMHHTVLRHHKALLRHQCRHAALLSKTITTKTQTILITTIIRIIIRTFAHLLMQSWSKSTITSTPSIPPQSTHCIAKVILPTMIMIMMMIQVLKY